MNLQKIQEALDFLSSVCNDLNISYGFHRKIGIPNFSINYKEHSLYIEVKAYNKRRDFEDTGMDYVEKFYYQKHNNIIIFFDNHLNLIYGNNINELMKKRIVKDVKYPKSENSRTGIKLYFPIPEAFIILSKLNDKETFKTNFIKLLDSYLEQGIFEKNNYTEDTQDIEKIKNSQGYALSIVRKYLEQEQEQDDEQEGNKPSIADSEIDNEEQR